MQRKARTQYKENNQLPLEKCTHDNAAIMIIMPIEV